MSTRKQEKSAAAPASKNGFSLISDEKLIEIYTTMVKCRLLEQRVRVAGKQSKADAGQASTDGHEAVLVGVLLGLQPEDAIAPSHSDFIANFIEGAPLDKMLPPLLAGNGRNGRVTARAGKALDRSSTVGAQLAVANDLAQVLKSRKRGKVVIALSGDGSTPMSVWHDIWNTASIGDLPVVFVCRSAAPAEPNSAKQQTDIEDLVAKAQTYGFPGIVVDGNDVVAVYRVASEAIAKARAGNGPTFIACKPYRPAGSKPQDPILNMEKYLEGKGLYRAQLKLDIVARFGNQLDEAIRAARESLSKSKQQLGGAPSLIVRERILNPSIWVPQA